MKAAISTTEDEELGCVLTGKTGGKVYGWVAETEHADIMEVLRLGKSVEGVLVHVRAARWGRGNFEGVLNWWVV